MNTHARFAMAAIAVLAVIGGAMYLTGSPESADGAATAAAAQATVPTEWTTYVSSRFAYAVDHPSGWVVTEATADWPNHHPPSPFGPTVDRFGATRDASTYVLVTSDPLDADQVAAERIAAIDFINAGEGSGSGCQSSDRQTITLDGVAARQEDLACFGTDHVIEVAVVAHGRIYLLDLFSRSSPLSPTDRATFDRFLSSFEFRAAAGS